MKSVYPFSDDCKNPLDHLAGQTVSSVRYKERVVSLGWSQEPWAVLSVCARPCGISQQTIAPFWAWTSSFQSEHVELEDC